MREAVGGISLFQIVIFFILVFTGIMCLTINHSKAFGVKDEIITIIESEELDPKVTEPFGLSTTTFEKINNRLNEIGYRTTGNCPEEEGWIGYNRAGVKENSTKNVAFCIKANKVDSVYYNDAKEKCKNNKCTPTSSGFPNMVYYDIVLFYQLDIPIIKQIFNFKIYGSTKVIFG